MGEVYLALDTRLRRLVALKLLPPELIQDEIQLRRFEQEAHAASVLNHPNILTVYEIGQTDSVHFIATEYVEGITLRQRIANGRMELSGLFDTAVQLASALVAAHQAGIVHRDIKPENIMIRDDGFLKVLDFGLAKLTENRGLVTEPEGEMNRAINTEPGVVMGTVRYMSPEQARGLEVDARSDIWSLGVVLYEMVAGRRPFDGLTRSDVMAAILREEPLALIRYSSTVPAELQRIITKALRKKQEERYQTLKDMLLDLQCLSRENDSKVEPERSAQTTETSSLAILPFRNLTNDETVSFYEFSLADAVITDLVRLRSLIVRPSSVVAKYLGQNKDPIEVGRELNVKAILSASFLYAKNRMRVTAQLIDVVNGEVLWGERIDCDADDIITVQDTIALRIIDGLQLSLSSKEQSDLARHVTRNAAAYEEYLRGRDLLGRYIYHTVANQDIEAAIKHLHRAIELDSQFALAYCGLGSCYINRLLKVGGTYSDLTSALEAFDKGLAIDRTIIEARVYMVYVHLARGEKEKAFKEIAALRHEAPNNAGVHFFSAFMYRMVGEYDNALQSWDSFVRLDPAGSVVATWNRARVLMYQGRFADAMLELDKGATTEPNHPFIKTFRAVGLFRQGDPVNSAKLLREVLGGHPEMDLIRPLLAMCLSAMGENEEARAQLTDRVKEVAALDHDVPYWLASAYVMEGELDDAFEWLEIAISLGNENLPWFEANPIWETVRDDPRFRILINRIKTEQSRRRIADLPVG
jgi:serine/threonine protein kinase/Flp pilus assembly protein TadD